MGQRWWGPELANAAGNCRTGARGNRDSRSERPHYFRRRGSGSPNEIGRLAKEGKIRLVLNLKKVTEIDTTGLGTLLFTLAKLRKAGGGLALAGLRPAHMELLVIAKMETVFRVFAHEQEAINSFFPDRQVPRFDILEFLEPLRRKPAQC